MGRSKQPQITKFGKTHYQNAPTIKTCKKTVSGKGQASEIKDSYTVLKVFSKVQDSQNNVKMYAKMEPPGTQNHKKSKKRTLEKTIKNNTAQI